MVNFSLPKRAGRLTVLFSLLVGLLFQSGCKPRSERPSAVHVPNALNASPAPSIGGKPPKIGKPVPDFVLEDRNGKSYRLSDFRGNLIFLNFWATWCPPCVEELPLMEALNQLLKAKNFMMIAVSVDDSWEAVDRFLSTLSRRPSFLILRDPDKRLTTEIYGTQKFPETYLIGPDLQLLKKFEGAYNWIEAERISEFEKALPSN